MKETTERQGPLDWMLKHGILNYETKYFWWQYLALLIVGCILVQFVPLEKWLGLPIKP